MNGAQTYSGDDALAGFLKDAGVSLPVAEVREIARGVAAAPPTVGGEPWYCLIGEELPDSLAAELIALAAEERASSASGLELKPAPADRLAALRREMENCGVQGFLVPLSDAHQSEFPPQNAQRVF